jgi:hypothetical protein
MASKIAERNRQIKKTLELAFGRYKVRVRGERGTSYGWANVEIAYSPRDWKQARELHTQCLALLRAAQIDLGCWYGYMDNAPLPEISITFDRCRYRETFVAMGGRRYGRQEDNEDWQLIEPEHAA